MNMIRCEDCIWYKESFMKIEHYCEQFDVGPVILGHDNLTFCLDLSSKEKRASEYINGVDANLGAYIQGGQQVKRIDQGTLYYYKREHPECIIEDIDL